MQALELLQIGKRNAAPPELEIMPIEADNTIWLANWLERKMDDGYMVVESKGNPGVFAVCLRPLVDWYGVWRVRIVDLDERDCAS